MPDYGYGGGSPQDQLSLYSMMMQQPGMGILGFNMMNPRMMFQQGQQRPPARGPVPWWQQMFWNKPDQAQDPDKRNDQQQQSNAMRMGQLGLSMLAPRAPTHTGPYPWI